MSNTESVRQASANTAPIHSSSINRLRSIGGGGASIGLGETDATNWLDAFAEIFARMSVSEAAPQETSVPPESETQQLEPTANRSENERSESEGQSENQTEEVNSTANEELSINSPVEEIEAIETVLVEPESIDDLTESEFDQDSETLVNVIPVDVEEAIVVDVAHESVQEEVPTAIVETYVADENPDKNNAKKDQGAVPVEQQEPGDVKHVAETKTLGQEESVGPDLAASAEKTVSEQGEPSSDDSGRKSRRGRKTHHQDRPNENASQLTQAEANASKRSGGIPIESAERVSSEPVSTVTKTEAASAIDNLPKPGAVQAAAVQAASKLAASGAASSRATSANVPNGLNGNVQPSSRVSSPVADPSGTKKATPNKNVDTNEAVNRAKLLQRVSKAFQHLGPDGGHVRLRLAPAELGTVRLEMRMQDRNVQARVVAESEAAASVLREHLPELRQRLESQGIQIERFQIEVESGDRESRSSLGHGQAETQQDGQDGRRSFLPRPERVDVSHHVSRFESQATDVGGPLVTVPIGGGVDVRL